ncbi:TonB-dependent receptor [Agriterribacter sp.]|uniref:TonB-dependent receptor n=1 Tax=Agriterribacter sp. TaxID=2821509 RepID=UPI002C84BFF8|nr:TonB-dependent receptor [Agriterribacter sp.]HRO45905.1 TonB-dependent receptor [Agriterribacter sp.]HRO97268.1 TonB-dependent receptor [Ferruginibacter sp.]
MRLLCFFLFVSFLSVYGKSSAQQITLSGKNLSLKKIFSVVKEQTGYVLFSKTELLEQSRPVTIDARDMPLQSFLEEVLKDQPLSYLIRDKTIFLYQKNAFPGGDQFKISSIQTEILKVAVSGRVSDENNKPIQGVSVMIDGTNDGTTTDSLGKYHLDVPDVDATIVFSAIGFNALKVKVNAQTVINVTLTAQNVVMEDIVFVGYGAQKKKNITGAISSVDSKVLQDRANVTIAGALQGIVPNLNISNNTGSPGIASSINIRGNTSINGGSPLVLVNGVPMDVNLVNPNDVESVSVLKDASSAAIYGARGAYGVILITTKNGKKGDKPVISVDANYTINTPTVFLETMDAMERLIYMNIGNQYENGQNYYDDYHQAAIIAHYNDPSAPTIIKNPNRGSVNGINIWDMADNTDWMRAMQRKSYSTGQYNVSVSGGSDKFDYYTSLSHMNQQGIARHFDEKYKRTNALVDLNYKVLDWIKIGTKVSVANSNKLFPPFDLGYRRDETYLMFHYALWPTFPTRLPGGGWPNLDGVSNPVQQQAEGGYNSNKIQDTWLSGNVRLTPLKHTSFNLDYSVNKRNEIGLEYMRNLPFHDREGNVDGYYYGSVPNSIKKRSYQSAYNVLNAYADYENTFGELHYVKVMAGFNQEYAENNWFSAQRRDLILDGIPYISLASGQNFTADAASETALRGAYSRWNYIFDNRYIFEMNFRYDGSSKFPKKDRFALFPSVSIGWRVDNEAFFSKLKPVVNLFKLRASYGSLGNQAVPGNYPYISNYSASQVNYTFGGERPMAVYAPGLVSATLTWETVTQMNLGVDFAMFKNKLNGSFDYYTRTTKNMLTLSERLPSILGVREPNSNAADMKTKGFDLSLGWTEKVGQVSYGASIILSDYSAEITRFSNPSGLLSSYYAGQKMGEIWGFETGGLFQTNEEALALDQTKISGRPRIAGDLWFVDKDGDKEITRGDNTLSNPGDQRVIGNSTPRYSYGVRSNIAWKGFDLVVFFQGVAKRQVRIDPSIQSFFLSQYMDEWVLYPKIGVDYWTPENRDAYFPRPLFTGDRGDISATQTRFLQNGAYLRLKQLSLSYSLPQQLTGKASLRNVRFYLTGTNLLTFTKMVETVDPELDAPNRYPLSKSLTLGLKADF